MQHHRMNKNHLFVIVFATIAIVIYSVTINKSDSPVYDSAIDQPERNDAEAVKIGDWTVVQKQENGERVYWFSAPGENGVSPGIFKKIIHNDDTNKEFTIISQCEAPKQTCDRLMKQFEELNKAYH